MSHLGERRRAAMVRASSSKDANVTKAVYQAVRVVLVRVVRELTLVAEVESDVTAARGHMRSHKRVRLCHKCVTEASDTSLMHVHGLGLEMRIGIGVAQRLK